MDSFTHGLAAALVAYALGLPGLVPFAVAGSMIVDTDVLLSLVADRDPRRYLFTHGGIAHSLAGAAAMAVPAWAVAWLVAPAAGFPGAPVLLTLAAALAGAYLHLGLDWLACPGIPLFAPVSDRKYTLGLLPGPSLLLFGATAALIAAVALGAGPPEALLPYGAVVAGFFAVRLAAFGLVRARVRNTARLVPRTSPLRWLAIGETPDAWTVGAYRIGEGMAESAVHPKYRGIAPDAAAPSLEAPEARRVLYHSYVTTVEVDDGALVVADPLRASGAIRYPPYFAEARIPLPGRG